ncbi:MAG: endonuclease NucS domain-containing protein [Cyanobacteria bacterium J06629_2]
MFDANTDWRFQSEQDLENFVSKTIEPLLNLKQLARQYYLNNQVCDLLAIDQKGQLAIVELKNLEDRYIIQQLTRYYEAVREYKPFSEEVNYQLPIRLIAIAPQFHQHNLIDQKYIQLDFELFTFRVLSTEADSFCFELNDLDSKQKARLNIPNKFHPFLYGDDEEIAQPLSFQLSPPKSLRILTEELSSEQEAYILAIRKKLLTFDERMIEVGKTTRTMYGMRKRDKDIYKTKLCAEFMPTMPGDRRPRLLLRLPYSKREFGGAGRTYKKEKVKGLTWVEIKHDDAWNRDSAIELFFYVGKSLNRYSYTCDLPTYSKLYREFTGESDSFHTLDDLLVLSLKEWKLRFLS